MKIRSSLIIILLIIFLGFGIYLIVCLSRETIKPNLNNTIIPIEVKVSSIKEALDVAENKAKSINKNVKLTNIYAHYDGYEQILDNTGHIGFDFCLSLLLRTEESFIFVLSSQ